MHDPEDVKGRDGWYQKCEKVGISFHPRTSMEEKSTNRLGKRAPTKRIRDEANEDRKNSIVNENSKEGRNKKTKGNKGSRNSEVAKDTISGRSFPKDM